MTKKLFVGSLSWNATDQMLQDLFSQVGQVVSVAIIKDKYTGKSKGFAFIEMSTEEEAEKAIQELNGKSVDGRAINISAALPQKTQNNMGSGNRYGSGYSNSRGGYSHDRDRRNRY